MENFAALFLPLFALSILLRLMTAPIHLAWKFFVNSACGFVCLWLLNSVSGFTGVYYPINWVTALIAGFLGLPGIGLLTLVQFVL